MFFVASFLCLFFVLARLVFVAVSCLVFVDDEVVCEIRLATVGMMFGDSMDQFRIKCMTRAYCRSR